MAEDVRQLREHLSARHVDRVVASIALMGFLNKFMDAMGIALEPEAIDDVSSLIEPTGWAAGQHAWGERHAPDGNAPPPPTDSFATYLRVLAQAPDAIPLERAWTRGVPSDPTRAERHLTERVGIDCPALAYLPDGATVRALTTALIDNLDATTSRIGLVSKGLAGLVFAATVGSDELVGMARRIASGREAGASGGALERSARRSSGEFDESALLPFADDPRRVAVLRLAHAVSSSPARVSADLVRTTTAVLSPEEIVETVCWMSVQQMLHRLYAFHRVAAASIVYRPASRSVRYRA